MTLGVAGRLAMVVLLAGKVAVAARAGGLPKLPADADLPRSEGSLGPVAFRHSTHVDERRPRCVGCHPSAFRILESGRTAGGEPIRHADMERGRHCGACHGKVAFGLEACDACHRQ